MGKIGEQVMSAP